MSFLSLFGWPRAPHISPPSVATQDRLANYYRFYRLYDGWSLREWLHSTNRDTVYLDGSYRRLKYNFCKPVVNLGATFLASIPIDWDVQENPDATAEAYAIWNRSHNFLDAAKAAGIYGDMVAIATVNDAGQPRIEFVSPDICNPVFDGRDYEKLRQLEIRYSVEGLDGDTTLHTELYTETSLTVWENNREITEKALSYEVMPCAWIRNMAVKGQPFGVSDVGEVADLVDEYDDIAQRQTRIIGYYAAPSIVFKGMQQSNLTKNTQTMFFLPQDGDAFFLERKGTDPSIENHLTRCRNAIAEISQVPAIAFGQLDPVTNISGVAIRLLFGPLINRTNDKKNQWEPALRCVMAQCLQASGYDVTADDVDLLWPDNIPVSGNEKIAEESAAVAAQLRSRRTAMNNLGVEDPDAELTRIVVEDLIMDMIQPPDVTKVAQAAAKGSAVASGKGSASTDVTDTAPIADQSAGMDLTGTATGAIAKLAAVFGAEDAQLERLGGASRKRVVAKRRSR